MEQEILNFFRGGAQGIGLAAGLILLLWLARAVITQIPKSVGDKVVSYLKKGEIGYEQTLKATLDFKARQLGEFYWPIYVRLQKDNEVWKLILHRRESDEVLRNLGVEIEKKEILPNHEAIVKIIEEKVHLSQADQALQDELMKYVRHVAFFKALRNSGVTEKFPYDLGEPWPPELFDLVKEKTERLQSEYDNLLESTRLVKSPSPSK